jgi:redox-sensing transcriptional repressor
VVERTAISVGVAARLFDYLRVLTQAKKIGKTRITSSELAGYASVNPSQARRDLAGVGKFGRRGFGYTVDALLSELREVLFVQGEQRIALVGAGRLGQAIGGSPIFAEHGITIAAIFDTDPAKVGRQLGQLRVSKPAQLGEIVRQRRIAIGVLAVPAASAQQVANELVEAGVKIIFNYSEALLQLPGEILVLTSNPAAELAAALALQLG